MTTLKGQIYYELRMLGEGDSPGEMSALWHATKPAVASAFIANRSLDLELLGKAYEHLSRILAQRVEVLSQGKNQ